MSLNITDRNQVIESGQPKFLTYAERITHNRADAEDAVQTAWLKVLFYPKPLETGTDVICLMYVATRHAAYSIHRRWGSRTTVLPDVLPGRRPDFDSTLDCKSLLKLLDARSRRVMILRHIVGLTDREVADVLGLQPGYIGVIAFRARRRLQSVEAAH